MIGWFMYSIDAITLYKTRLKPFKCSIVLSASLLSTMFRICQSESSEEEEVAVRCSKYNGDLRSQAHDRHLQTRIACSISGRFLVKVRKSNRLHVGVFH